MILHYSTSLRYNQRTATARLIRRTCPQHTPSSAKFFMNSQPSAPQPTQSARPHAGLLGLVPAPNTCGARREGSVLLS